MNVTPSPNAPHVLELCDAIVQGTRPISVPCNPSTGSAVNECFPVVDNYVGERGGSAIVGWAIWERPGVFVEAEFHAVWRSPEGQLLDIVPRSRPFAEIIFLPDPARKYSGCQVDNIRKALVPDKDVKRFLFLFHRRFEMLNSGERAYQREVSLPKAAQRELLTLYKELERLERRMRKKYPESSQVSQNQARPLTF